MLQTIHTTHTHTHTHTHTYIHTHTQSWCFKQYTHTHTHTLLALTWCFEWSLFEGALVGFSLLDVTADVEEGEKEVVGGDDLQRQLNLHLRKCTD